VQRDRCGHTYAHPLPAYEDIPSIYPNTYYTVNKKSPLYLDGWIYEKKLAQDARKLRDSLRGHKIRSIVDVGCGEISRLIELKKAFEAISSRDYPGKKVHFADGAKNDVEA